MRRSGALWGALLIFIGIVWILSSTNIVKIDILGSVMALWPIFIIAAGITFFLKRESHLLRVILWVLVFAIIGGYGVYLGINDTALTDVNKTFEMKSDIESASLEVNIGAANFNIGSSDSALADVHTTVRGIRYDYDAGINSTIEFSQKVQFGRLGRKQSFKADLNKNIPWDIELNTGAINGTLNFKDIMLRACTINTGACDLDIEAGDKLNDSRIVINGGAVNINLSVPENVGLKISSSSAVTKVNGNISMLKQGNVHLSENFDSTPNKLYLEITSGVANVTVNR